MKIFYALGFALLSIATLLPMSSTPVLAFGDEGHETIALIADHFLKPAVKTKVKAMLDADTDTLTSHGIAKEATWADKYRDSDRNTTQIRYKATKNWHFVDIELQGDHAGDEGHACYGVPLIWPHVPASKGPANDCVFNKIEQFAAELKNSQISAKEKLIALKFVLHLVGDIHQPLHTSNNKNAGGNSVMVDAPGIPPGTLHSYWDTAFIREMNATPTTLANQLIAGITDAKRAEWTKGTPREWAKESFTVIKDETFMNIPSSQLGHTYQASGAYVEQATSIVAEQLQKAGVRLAYILNNALE